VSTTHTFSVQYLDENGVAIPNATVVGRFTDMNTGEQFNPSSLEWESAPASPWVNFTEDVAQAGRWYYSVDITSWGARRVLFIAKMSDAVYGITIHQENLTFWADPSPGTYYYNVAYFGFDGTPPTGANVAYKLTDSNSAEQWDFTLGAWVTTAADQWEDMTQDPNQKERWYASVDYSNWGTRKVEFVAIKTAPSEASEEYDEEVTFLGSYFYGLIYPASAVAHGMYVSVQDVRDFGITTDIIAEDADVVRLISHACLQIDMYTNTWYNLRSRTIELTNPSQRSRLVPSERDISVTMDLLTELMLPHFLVTVRKVYINNKEVDITGYRIDNSIPYDYEDPRLYIPQAVFKRDRVQIDGLWGCVADSTGTVLEPVKRATLLTIANIIGYENINDAPEEDPFRQFIVQETTDRHSYTLSSKLVTEALQRSEASVVPTAAKVLLRPFLAPRMLE